MIVHSNQQILIPEYIYRLGSPYPKGKVINFTVWGTSTSTRILRVDAIDLTLSFSKGLLATAVQSAA